MYKKGQKVENTVGRTLVIIKERTRPVNRANGLL